MIQTSVTKQSERSDLTSHKNHERVTSEDDQLAIIIEYFTKLFASDDKPEDVTPEKMEPAYTAEEIEKAACKLKNNKATGRDEVHAEFIKYGSPELYLQISKLLNITSETGDYPEEIRRGILNPLPKPPKKDEKVNVKPIILLSVLRKIITITLIDRCWERMGRSNTEQVFFIKLLAEKARTSENYDIFLLLLDMSEAFDTVNRSKLMKILKDILTPSELHMMYLLVNDVIFNVRIGSKIGEDILTAIGICQGDYLSALPFIRYLAYAIKPLPTHVQPQDYQQTMWSALDWIIDRDARKINIDPKYADDITFIRSDRSKINQIERMMPKTLLEQGLFLNKCKTEKYHISRTSDIKWRSCKYQASLLGTEEDILKLLSGKLSIVLSG